MKWNVEVGSLGSVPGGNAADIMGAATDEQCDVATAGTTYTECQSVLALAVAPWSPGVLGQHSMQPQQQR